MKWSWTYIGMAWQERMMTSFFISAGPLNAVVAYAIMAFCLLLLFCALPGVVFSCSCFPGSFNRPRTQAIQEDFCGEYSRPDVYTARVVGATCNCIPASGDANLQCQDYTFATGNTSVVNVEVVNRTRLPDERSCRRPSSYEVDTCSAQATRLAGSGKAYGTDTTNNWNQFANWAAPPSFLS